MTPQRIVNMLMAAVLREDTDALKTILENATKDELIAVVMATTEQMANVAIRAQGRAKTLEIAMGNLANYAGETP